MGECKRAGQNADACTSFPDLQLCATGLSCNPNSNVCEARSYNPLQRGEMCYDATNFALLGSCTDGYCDVLGTNVCEASKADGEMCGGAIECLSNECANGVCAPLSFCVGR